MRTEFSFDLPPKKAIAFLESKKAFVKKLDEASLANSARARATRIANLSSLEMTSDIYQSLIEAQEKGIPLGEWKKGIFQHPHKKGWIAGFDENLREYVIADPKTGEYFGTPRRLETIYRTNMQSAYSAQRYQQMRDNADNRPYWQYSAVNDGRTRPSHSAMHGLVYRYDDPFWHTFYPPNGFNCRCSVIALNDREIAQSNMTVGNSEGQLIETERQVNKTTRETTRALKLGDRVIMPDRGFDTNVGRQVYKPNLDHYPEALAHQFAKREMGGESFKLDYHAFEKEVEAIKAKLGNTGKLNADQMIEVRNQLSREYKFSAGVLSAKTQQAVKSETKTVWLSDDTLIKQFNSRSEDGDFTTDDYKILPDLLYQPEMITFTRDKHFQFFKLVNQQKYVAIVKVLDREIFIQSFRKVSQREWDKVLKNR
ncbi:phage head morphogenesis protein [Pasteurellaceae bacterium Macca]|nr:phage head morphogenesis protein [Pasteurellaceae bacterium Macca]